MGAVLARRPDSATVRLVPLSAILLGLVAAWRSGRWPGFPEEE